MGLVQSIKNLFRRGATKIGAMQSLNSITDHPKINVDDAEYQRIRKSLDYYEGNYPLVSYKNSNGKVFKREYSTINMLKKVSNRYASVVFNEQCEINVDGEEVSAFINDIFEHNDFKKNFSKYLEPMFALGGLACRPYFDANTKQIEFSWALANAFYPLETNSNNISECAIPFTSTRTEGGKTYYYTLLEFHEWQNGRYVITNELYKSEEANQVGNKVSLKELYSDLEEQVTFDALSRPLFAYLKPSGFNNINPYSPLGLGVCDNCRKTLDRINRVYDEFDQEIEKGKRRIVVSESLLSGRMDENGQIRQFFDDDETVFQAIPGANMDDLSVRDLTSEIRTNEYIAAINHHLKTLEMETNLSSGTFTFDGKSVKTATEIVSENSLTYQTRSMQITEIEKFIKELVVSVCELGKALDVYSGEIPKYSDIAVDFQDGAFQDKDALADYYLKLFNAKLIPGEEVLQNLLELPEKKALELYTRAKRDVADITTGLFANRGNPPEEE